MIKKIYSTPELTVVELKPMKIMAGSYIEQGQSDGNGEGQFDASAKGTSLFFDSEEENSDGLW